MINFLKGQFVKLSKREKFFSILLIGLFFSFFMIYFQPFGVNNYNPKETITLFFVGIMVAMGVYLILLLLINEFLIFPLIFKGNIYRWQILIWLIWSNIYSATGLFLFYNILGDWHDFRLSSWLEFILNFTALGIIPLTVIFLFGRMRQIEQLTETAEDYNLDANAIIHFPSDSLNNLHSYSLENILFLESEDNYVAIHFINEGTFSKTLIRSTLKKIDDLDLHPALIRCHRSFIVNLSHLVKYEGNKQQGMIVLRHVSKSIPVSKSYASNLVLRLR